MVCQWSDATLQKILKSVAIISGILSACCISIWIKSCYDVLILSDLRQNLRVSILQRIDEEIEDILDQYVPGPPGHRGMVGIVEPEGHEQLIFENPIIFVIIGISTMLAQVIHFFLAIWLYVVAKTGSYRGVRTWLIGTLILVAATVLGLITQLIFVTFHGLSLVTTLFTLTFYFIGLFFACRFKMQTENARKTKNFIFSSCRFVFVEIGEVLL